MTDIPSHDQKAWDEIVARRAAMTPGEPGRARARARAFGDKLRERARDGVHVVPGGDAFLEAFSTAMAGLTDWSSETAATSVPRDRIVRHYQRRGLDVEVLADLRVADLIDLDRHRSRTKLAYTSTLAAEGSVAGFAISGGTALAVGGVAAGGVAAAPGAALVVGALATDSAAVLMGAQRVVSHVAAHYGYDTRDQAERLFALGVLGYGTASAAGRAAAYGELSRLTQAMARRATWQQLDRSVVTQVVKKVFQLLGLRLTQRTLSKAIPVVGVLTGAGLNAWTIQRVHDSAAELYRERWLMDRWGFEHEDTSGFEHDTTGDDAPIDLVGIVDAELETADDPITESRGHQG